MAHLPSTELNQPLSKVRNMESDIYPHIYSPRPFQVDIQSSSMRRSCSIYYGLYYWISITQFNAESSHDIKDRRSFIKHRSVLVQLLHKADSLRNSCSYVYIWRSGLDIRYGVRFSQRTANVEERVTPSPCGICPDEYLVQQFVNVRHISSGGLKIQFDLEMRINLLTTRIHDRIRHRSGRDGDTGRSIGVLCWQ